jgi:hypothetical protein
MAWKLYYNDNLEKRFLENHIIVLRKKSGINQIISNIQSYSLLDQIHNKKCKNLQNLRKNDAYDVFITLLKRNWQVTKSSFRLSKSQLSTKQIEVQKHIK